ncbi:Derlin-1 [Smittium culicis]|uniref:Derlin n=1 Tax=Smittium culicis TaxID=133412 RepID=A0A1R1XBE4_9FUNG|nr:Derlin-1 [Smittium culicis]
MAGTSFQDSELARWYKGVPIITRYLLSSIAIISTVGNLHLINPFTFLLSWPNVYSNFEIWRLVTGFLFIKFSLNGLFNFFHLYRDSVDLEEEIFANQTADYAWFLTFCAIVMASISFFYPAYILSEGLLMSVIFLWCKYNEAKIINVMFGFKVEARYFPYFLMFLEFIIKGGYTPYAMIYGAIASRLYYYLKIDYPAHGGRRQFIRTPQLYLRIFPQSESRSNSLKDSSNPGFTAFAPKSYGLSSSSQKSSFSNPNKGGHLWGQGKKLA